mmetsp:Transcript_2540/g.5468  ORF Transcript_2540/g.5468 Transcript_2540/m.5468 type:complete len:84 (+) Transcript_2540:871-1122(+)
MVFKRLVTYYRPISTRNSPSTEIMWMRYPPPFLPNEKNIYYDEKIIEERKSILLTMSSISSLVYNFSFPTTHIKNNNDVDVNV